MDYRIATTDEKKAADCREDYDLLIGPGGFDCVLTDPEDRMWCRDGKQVIAELNRQSALLDRAMAIISNAIMHGMPITDEVAAVRNEIVGVVGH